ncbi:DUF3047 domain-containing protein [Roseateles violae]|uniref:DUF3047 domain-containing protein n=1 Tax=Roseateles violae TaxID=3058042 RepID=A0ABT8DW69_9BURK|nr:DUF3047 domain-containing protein [Pelomonas sp. PFR6]MDN3921139.1 DUF3047 domain-containing protein [Pelomonas sp. PFR6]
MPAPLAAWSSRDLPGKRSTQYSYARRGERPCVLAQASRSVSLWRRSLQLAPERIEALQFDWWISGHDAGASVTRADTDDAPARLLLGFDGDEASLSARNRMQFELARALTGEAPPYATLMYVWDAQAAPGTVVVSSRSDRIRKIVVGSGSGGHGQWQRLRRDVVADYRLAFGEAPGRLISMALMTDGDNTGSRAEACYGDILLLDASQQPLDGSLQL